MCKQIKLNEVEFVTEWDKDKVYLTAHYKLLTAKLSFNRPGACYDMELMFKFFETDEFTYIKTKLLKLIQLDLDYLNQ